MPTVSMFFGIIVRMYYQEHAPPHFHAEYQGQRGVFDFDGNLTKGNFYSTSAKRLIKQWATLHREELSQNWDNARREETLFRIAPLD